MIATQPSAPSPAAWCATNAPGSWSPPATPRALAAALRRLHGDPVLRARLGAAGRAAVAAGYTHAAWAAGMSRALAAAGAAGAGKAAASVARPMSAPCSSWCWRCSSPLPRRWRAPATTSSRDCYDDGDLDGNYTASQIRDARNNLPADVDQYSDCRDVLARALGGTRRRPRRQRRLGRRRGRRRRRDGGGGTAGRASR